jgi:Tfp pilus assembly protein PilN
VGAAAALIATDAVVTRMEVARVRTENAALNLRLRAAEPSLQVRDQLMSERSGLAGARQRMATAMNPVVNWDAVLAALAERTPERVRLTELRLGVENGRPVCHLSGETLLGQSSERLKGFLDALAAVPLVQECRMGAVQRTESPAGALQQFEMTMVLVDLPAGVVLPERVASVEDRR